MIDYRQFTFTAAKIEPLLHKVVENGSRIEAKQPAGKVIRLAHETAQQQLETLDASYKRILNPHIYKVSLSKAMKNLKLDFIEKRIK